MPDTQALGTFGVYGRPTDDEVAILAIADEYRERLVALLWQRFRAVINLRNDSHPELFAAMVEHEAAKAKVWMVERQIKALHSHVRDRNAVTLELEESLRVARQRAKTAAAEVKTLRQPWLDTEREFREYYKSIADWKNVKSLDKRRELYSQIEWPEHLQSYADLWIAYDLRQRDLGKEYLHLHPTIRAEIVAASRQKRGATEPGIRYEYHRPPICKPWGNLTVQIAGGLVVRDAMDGKSRVLSIEPRYTNHKASGEQTVYEIRQQIGTAIDPVTIKYRVKFHRTLPADAIIQRWMLKIVGGRRTCIPLLKKHGLSKPIGKGLLTYDITWSRCKDGLQVCQFLGDHVNERLILPNWLIDQRLSLNDERTFADNQANRLLASRGATPATGAKQGLAALLVYCEKFPDDVGAANQLHHITAAMQAAKRTTHRAVRCIESIYSTVVYRVCSLHGEMVPDIIDLARLKRYDTRDLLREDRLPRKSRDYLHAAAPGKLTKRLRQYGLASGEVPADFRGVARETDVFTSWVNSLGRKTGAKQQQECHRSQMASAGQVVQ